MSDQTLKEQQYALVDSVEVPGDKTLNSLERTEPAYRIPLGAPIALPKNWEITFDFLPEFEPASLNLEDPEEAFKLFHLSEDIWSARSLDKEWTIDLGWYPEADPKGQFRVVLVHGDTPEDWNNPFYTFETRKLEEALNWIRSMLRQSFRP